MGFFKDFKEDFSQAVSDLMPEEDEYAERDILENDDMVVNTLDAGEDIQPEFPQLNGLFEQAEEEEAPSQPIVQLQKAAEMERAFAKEMRQADARMTMEERKRMNEEAMAANAAQFIGNSQDMVSDETAIITEGTTLNGDISSNGSIDIRGRVGGNVTCNGKLVVTGILEGNSHSSEFFADAAKIEGEVRSTGTVKIGIGSVVIGNISATSAVIAGAIKGDIDVQGPVVVDTSAVIMGNIKSRSVQINNGAVIEGFCSQCYADIDVQGLFDDQKGK